MAEQRSEAERPARRDSADDIVLPFATIKSRVVGRIVRLGPAADTILTGHDYPDIVSELLGEAVALTALLGAPLNEGGRLILQTKGDGPVSFLVAHFDTPGAMRGYASFDRERVAALGKPGAQAGAKLLGEGRMAMTIDPGGAQPSYQGIVALEGGSLTEAAQAYFRQSEQLPTLIRLAVARHYVGGSGEGAPDASAAQRMNAPEAPKAWASEGANKKGWRWRAGGLIVQHVPAAGGDPKPDETPEERDQRLHGDDDENWLRVATLASTVEAHELIDPTLSPERLLLRLFHEEGVRVSEALPVTARCRCSRERIHGFLKGFSDTDLADMLEADGAIAVTCEFCSTKYRFAEGEVERS